MHKIDEKLANVTARIARAAEISGRSASDVALLAVSKTQPADQLRRAYQAGARSINKTSWPTSTS
jgi:uncharacterized pyridoxal phosphate-containing UPF0001 family protein